MKKRTKRIFLSLAMLPLLSVAAPTISEAADANEAVIPTKTASGRDFPVYYRDALPVTADRARYTGFNPKTELLKAGTVRREGAKPLATDIVFERDVAITLRDGTKIYADVFRPSDNEKHPAILCISPYGKEVGGQALDDLPGRLGVPLAATSGLERFEGADPGFWVANGYAVVNPDPRGAYMSEGNINYWGTQYAEDGYDIVEWIAAQPWCNEKVGMSGNSWLTASQWFIAGLEPPHLAAIAPWEGFSDHYRETSCRGGIPMPEFAELIAETFASNKGLLEDQPRMIAEYPFMNDYWEDKIAKLENIKIPAYVVASFTNGVHTYGTFRGYRNISSKDKWLRVHNTQEWNDYYNPENEADLKKFFDHYLKGVDNDWEKTSKVRLSVYDLDGKDIVNRPENEFPLARTDYQKFYLNASNMSLSPEKKAADSTAYDSESADSQVYFEHEFDRDTEITGYMKLHLYVAAESADDMDLAVRVEKIGQDGKVLNANAFGEVAATGFLRVSCRKLDAAKSTEAEPYLTGTSEEKLTPGEIVPVEIGIWPMGMIYHAGEKIRLSVGAYKPAKAMLPFGSAKIEVPTDKETFYPGEKHASKIIGGNADEVANPAQVITSPPTHNKGRHIIYTGGQYDSYLLLPIIPQKKN